jgi:hypothetical protein
VIFGYRHNQPKVRGKLGGEAFFIVAADRRSTAPLGAIKPELPTMACPSLDTAFAMTVA